MNEPKTILDSAFATHVLAEHEVLRAQECLNAAERVSTRELLGFCPELLALAQNYRFEKEAYSRIGRVRDSAKAWLLAIGALAGVIASAVALYKG